MKKFLVENWWWSVVFLMAVAAAVFGAYWVMGIALITNVLMLLFLFSGRAKRLKQKNNLLQLLSFLFLILALVGTAVAAIYEKNIVGKVAAVIPFLGTMILANMPKGGNKK